MKKRYFSLFMASLLLSGITAVAQSVPSVAVRIEVVAGPGSEHGERR